MPRGVYKRTVKHCAVISAALTGKIGEESNNWQGGLTPLYYLLHNSLEYKQWRIDVFTKDKFTC